MFERRCPQCRMTGQHKLQCSYRNKHIGSELDVEHMARTGEVCEPPRSPFPHEVVERAIDAGMKAFDDAPTDMSLSHDEQERAWWRARFNAEFSVIADYLRSEEARERAKSALFELDARGEGDGYGNQVDAVIAALLGELA